MVDGYVLMAVNGKKRCDWEVLGVHDDYSGAYQQAMRLIHDNEKRQLWIVNPNGWRCPACGGRGCDRCDHQGFVTRWRMNAT